MTKASKDLVSSSSMMGAMFCVRFSVTFCKDFDAVSFKLWMDFESNSRELVFLFISGLETIGFLVSEAFIIGRVLF